MAKEIPRTRIALDASLAYGTSTGDSTYWSGLIEGLSQLSLDLEICFVSPIAEPPEFPASSHLRWVHAPAGSSRWWNLVTFPQTVRKLEASIAHTQYSISPLMRTPAITTVHDVSFFIGPQWFSAKNRNLLQLGVRSACRRAKRVMTVSETSKSEIEQYIPAANGKVRAVYNATPSWIQAMDRETARMQVQAEFGVMEPYVLTVGTRWERKNMDLAIRAMSGLRSDLRHRLLVTGKKGASRDGYGERGIATGYVSNRSLSALYSAAELYLAPSFHEGFGIPVLEAFRCGCPVLSSMGGALPEVVANEEAVIRSWETRDWTAKIEQVLSDPSKLKRMSEQGRARERDFSWTSTAEKTLAVYAEVLQETKK